MTLAQYFAMNQITDIKRLKSLTMNRFMIQ